METKQKNHFTSFFQNRYFHIYVLIAIILVAIFFRFYNIPFRYGLGDEEVREAIIGIEGARQLQAPMTGGFSSAGSFTWGPWFYYQMIIVSLLFPYLYSPWIYLDITSVVCVIVMYKIGEELEGKNFGLLLALFCALSPAFIISATHLTFPDLTNIFAVVAFFLFTKIAKKDISYWWSFIFGIVLGIAINIHYQMTGLLILPVILLVYKYKKFLYFVFTSIGITLTFIPLLLWDLTNHWHNFRNILYYYQYGKNAIYVPNSWTIYLRDFWPSYWADVLGVPQIIASIIMILFVFVAGWMIVKKKISKPTMLILAAFMFNFILLRYYWGEKFFGYLNYLRPFVIIATCFTIWTLYAIAHKSKYPYTKYLVVIGVIVLILFILPRSIERLNKDPFTMNIYRQVAIIQKKFPNKKFTVYICASPGKSTDTAEAKSTIFLFDLSKRLSSNGKKLGVYGRYCLPPKIIALNNASSSAMIRDTSFFDFSKASDSALTKAYWKPYSFGAIYDSTTRWWFKEQP